MTTTPKAWGQARKSYALALLTAVYALNLFDRNLVVLLLQSIKTDLMLSDTQLGLLTGILFGLFYAVLGVPIARWADRGDRVTITSLAMTLWTATVMCTVFVANFWQLAVARLLAGVGEAGCKPPTYALVGDIFPEPAERTRALSIYLMASPLAALLSFGLGGWLNDFYGWRATLLIMSLPGLLLAVLVRFTLSEPRPRRPAGVAAPRAMPVKAVIGVLWTTPALRHIIMAFILLYVLSMGLSPWYGAFLVRSHGLSSSVLGLSLGAIFGVCGMVSILCGGWIANRFFLGREDRQMRFSAAALALSTVPFLGFLTLPTPGLALAALAMKSFLFSLFMAPTYSILQRMVPDRMRATTMAIVMLLANLIGMGVGPLIVGMLSDAMAPALGADSLRWAMIALSFVGVWSSFHFLRAARHVLRDMGRGADG